MGFSMAQVWYYVVKGERVGPVDADELKTKFNQGEFTAQDFVWKKGFDGWKKAFEVEEIASFFTTNNPNNLVVPTMKENKNKISKLSELPANERSIFIRIGRDRADGVTNEYGPFDLSQIKKMKEENRINGKTEVFTKLMSEWMFLADFKDYQDFFQEVPPPITESDRRNFTRKPFIARLFIQNNKKVFEGICRDISIGGMQVLVDDFPGSTQEKLVLTYIQIILIIILLLQEVLFESLKAKVASLSALRD